MFAVDRVCILLATLLRFPYFRHKTKAVVKPDTPVGNFSRFDRLEIDFDKRVTLIEQFTIMFRGANRSVGILATSRGQLQGWKTR